MVIIIIKEFYKDTIREPLVILDGDLNVVIVNPAFYRKFLVNRSETEGSRIYDLGSGQWNIPGLRKLLETIIFENEAIEDYRKLIYSYMTGNETKHGHRSLQKMPAGTA